MENILFIKSYDEYKEYLEKKLRELSKKDMNAKMILSDGEKLFDFTYEKYVEINLDCVTKNANVFNKELIDERNQHLIYLEEQNGNIYSRLRLFGQMFLEICNDYRLAINEEKIVSDRVNVCFALDYITNRSLHIYNVLYV